MRHIFYSFVCFCLFLLVPCRLLGALELEFSGGLNNMTYDPGIKTAYSEIGNEEKFEGFRYIFGDFIIRSNSFDKMGFNIRFSRDNILRNSLFTQITANWDNIKLDFGPYIGVMDSVESLKKPELGIIGSFEVAFPGIFFFSFNGSASLGSKSDRFSNNSRETFGAKLGFWAPYIIPTLSASLKNFAYTNDSVEITDKLIRLMFSTEIHAKNFPVIFRVDSGFEIFSREYVEDTDTNNDEIRAIFVGIEAKFQVNKLLKVILGFETPVYCLPVENVENPSAFKLFKAYAGMGFNIYKSRP